MIDRICPDGVCNAFSGKSWRHLLPAWLLVHTSLKSHVTTLKPRLLTPRFSKTTDSKSKAIELCYTESIGLLLAEGTLDMNISIQTTNDHRIRTVQPALGLVLGVSSDANLLAPGGSTCSSAGSSSSCSSCAVIAQPEL